MTYDYEGPPPITIFTVSSLPYFKAEEHFLVNMSDDARVKICDMGEMFAALTPKEELPVPEATFVAQTLTNKSVDEEIIEKFYSEKEEIKLSQLYSILETQGHGQEGDILVVNGQANLFPVVNAYEQLRVVCASWLGGSSGWYLSVHSASILRWCFRMRTISQNLILSTPGLLAENR